MNQLIWNPTAGANGRGIGASVSGAHRLTHAMAPPLGFTYDLVHYDDSIGVMTKTLAGVTTSLSSTEKTAVTTFLNGNAAMNNASLVWGVTAAGIPLGLVASTTIGLFQTTGPQPQPIALYKFLFTTKTWVLR